MNRWPPHAYVLLTPALAIAAATATYFGSSGLDTLLVLGENGDVWFEADCPRVFENITDQRSVQSRSAVHPLFTLCTYPPVALLRAAGLEPIIAVRIVRALTAAACLLVFFALLRIVGCRRLDSAIMSVLAAVSAGAMFWFVVPETYPAGLLTILLALGLVALGENRRLSPAWDVAVNVATAAFTITNWMAGLAATFVRWPIRRALAVILVAAAAGLLLLAIQNRLFPSAALVPVSLEERIYTLHPDAGGPARVVPAFLSHSMVVPAVETTNRYGDGRPIMTVQHSLPGSANPWGLAAVVLWTVLLSLGVYGMCVCRQQRRLRLVLSLTIAGQLILHLLYGLETFTYACHFGPLLVLVAALATLSPARRPALVLAVALILCAGINNLAQLRQARTFVEQLGDNRGARVAADGSSAVERHNPLLTPTACEPQAATGQTAC